jgi:hypothetical protein
MHHSIPAEHTLHDLDLIAGHAAGDLSGTERSRADILLNSCTWCADLRRDLIAIAAAIPTLPSTAHAPRDYRLDAAQAARLRRGGWLTRFLRPFAAPRSPARPMAMAFSSLGLAGLLVVNILPSLLGGAASLAPTRDQAAAAPGATAAAAASAGSAENPVAGYPAASLSAEYGTAGHATPEANITEVKTGDSATLTPVAVGGGERPKATDSSTGRLDARLRSEAPTTNLLLVGSLAFLALGLALFGLRLVARRLR